MRLFDKLLKRDIQEQEQIQKQEQVEEKSADINLPPRYKRESVKQRYPDGLPLEFLQKIDYSKFGAILKQRQLLPPSYDRNPVGIEIIPSAYSEHKVRLIFKSKTSASYRLVSIRGYNISMSINNSSTYEYMPIMSREWQKFCTRIMWLADMGLKGFSMVNDFTLTDEEMGL